jgi:hypothetical protein
LGRNVDGFYYFNTSRSTQLLFLEICLTNKFHHRGQGYFLNRLVKSLTMKT